MRFRVNSIERESLKRLYDSRWGYDLKEDIVSDYMSITYVENKSTRRLMVEHYVVDVDTLDILSSVYPPSIVLYNLQNDLKELGINKEVFLFNLEKACLGAFSFKEVLIRSKELTSSKLRQMLVAEDQVDDSISQRLQKIDIVRKLQFFEYLSGIVELSPVVVPTKYPDILVLHQISILLEKENFFIATLKNPKLYSKLLDEFKVRFLFTLVRSPEYRIKLFIKDNKGVLSLE